MNTFKIIAFIIVLSGVAVFVFHSGLYRTFKGFGEDISRPEKTKFEISVKPDRKNAPTDIKLFASISGRTKDSMTIDSIEWFVNGKLVSVKKNASYKAATPGVYEVFAKAKNLKGEEFSSSQKIEIAKNIPPDCSFTHSDVIIEGKMAFFYAHCNDPDGEVVKRLWDFGDGTPTVAFNRHTYSASGTYVVTLLAYDDSGGVSAVQSKIYVQPAK